MEWQDPVLIKDDNNNDYHLNYKATVYLLPSVLHILILTEKVFLSSTLQMKKLRFKGLNSLLELTEILKSRAVEVALWD